RRRRGDIRARPRGALGGGGDGHARAGGGARRRPRDLRGPLPHPPARAARGVPVAPRPRGPAALVALRPDLPALRTPARPDRRPRPRRADPLPPPGLAVRPG